MNRLDHTSVNRKKPERAKKKDSMDDDDERYSLPDAHRYAFFFFLNLTFSGGFFSPLSLSFFLYHFERRDKVCKEMVFVIYFTCLYITHTHTYSII